MAGVGLVTEGVEDEDVEVLEERDALGRDIGHVGEVGGGAEAVAGDGVAAVGDGDVLEGHAEECCRGTGGGVDAVDDDAGGGGVAVYLAEGVLEDALDDFGGGVVGEEGQAVGLAEGEGAEGVHAEDVVGVAVGVQDGVDVIDALADGLGVEVGAGVDDDRVAVEVDAEGGAGAAVGGVGAEGVLADVAVAAEGGDAHGGAAAEEGEGGFCLGLVGCWWLGQKCLPQGLKPLLL